MRHLVTYDSFKAEVERMRDKIIQDTNLRTVKIDLATKSLICGRKHRIAVYPGGLKRLNDGGIDVRQIVNCANCKKDFSKKEQGFSSCLQGCDTYMCPFCSACPKKHILKWWIGLPQKYAARGGTS